MRGDGTGGATRSERRASLQERGWSRGRRHGLKCHSCRAQRLRGNGSVHLLEPAAADLAGADDVEAEGVERREIWVGQDEDDVIEAERFPVVQADEDVAALDAGLVGGAASAYLDNGE